MANSNFFDLEQTWLGDLNTVSGVGVNVPDLSTLGKFNDTSFNNLFQTQMIQNETARLNQKQQSIDLAKTSQNRMITLNNSYSARYGAYSKIIIVLVVCFLVFIGLMFLHGALPDIPGGVMDLGYIIILSVGFIYCLVIYMDIQSRDPVYFDQINLPPPTMPDSSGANQQMLWKNADMGNLLGGSGLGACMGGSCCDGVTTVWDPVNQVCKGSSIAVSGSASRAAGFTTLEAAPYFLSEGSLYGGYGR